MRPLFNVLLTVSLISCESATESAYVGDCAVYPDGGFDYGQIGIGHCLAGPSDLVWTDLEEGPGGSTLIVTNANPYLDFDSGSVLTIARSGLPTNGSRRLMHQIADAGQAGAVPIESFSGGMALVEDRALVAVTVRYSEGAENLEQDDALVFVDLSDPNQPRLASVGPEGASELAVGADPVAISYDEASGLAFVANITSGNVSVIDLASDPVAAIDAVPPAEFQNEGFEDRDGSGSQVIVADLDVEDPETFPHDQWSLVFAEGRFQLSLPSPAGVSHVHSTGQGDWVASPLGLELSQDDTDGAWGELSDPQIWLGYGGHRMAMADSQSGGIVAATLTGNGGVWAYESNPVLLPRENSWDGTMGGPMVFVEGETEWLFYDGQDAFGRSYIGVASSTDGVTYQRENGGNPVINPGVGNHDSDGVYDPHVVYDAQMDLYRMFFSAYDGVAWSLSQATSDNLLDWNVDENPLMSNVAAPVAVYSNGQYRIWASKWTGVDWNVLAIQSVNGWSLDQVDQFSDSVTLVGEDASSPPGVGLHSTLSESWSIEGEVRGMAGVSFQAGQAHSEPSVGWRVFLSAGAYFGENALHSDGANGFSPSHWDSELSQVYGTFTDADGVKRIGLVDLTDPDDVAPITLLGPREEGFDLGGVSDPVIFQTDSEWRMLYAGEGDGVTSIGLARSQNGLTWIADEEPVLSPGEDWDSVEIRPGSVNQDGDGFHLWYSGSDGVKQRVGLAFSTDGLQWTKEAGLSDEWVFEPGVPGSFDDSAVADPFVLIQDDELHMWYSAFDGDLWSIGHALSDDNGQTWQRRIGGVSGGTFPVVQGQAGSFDQLGARRPVVSEASSGELHMLYTGQDAAVDRLGLAVGHSSEIWHRSPARATTGDAVLFETVPGDEGDLDNIRLNQAVDGFVTSGYGVTESLIDEERGYLILSSAASAYLYVIDIRDDSTAGFTDNLFEIEAVLVASTIPGAIGFRAMALASGTPYLYALNDSPESVMVFNLDQIVEDQLGEVHLEAVVGAMPAARGAEKDKGSDTLASVGPSNLVLDGDRLFVANFNANSVSVYDLSLGPYGTWTHEIPGIGENPHAMALSPDGSLLAVASFVGRLSGDRVGSQIALIDTTSLEIVGWISND